MKASNTRPGIQRTYPSVNPLSSCLPNLKPDIYFVPLGRKTQFKRQELEFLGNLGQRSILQFLR